MPHFTQSLKKELSFYGFEPVNLVTGSVLYEGIDFFFPGALPLEWKRVYHSDILNIRDKLTKEFGIDKYKPKCKK